MMEFPRELLLEIGVYLNYIDFQNYVTSVILNIDKRDFIHLVNLKCSNELNNLLNLTTFSTGWLLKYLLILGVNDTSSFMIEYRNSAYIYGAYNKLYHLVYKEIECSNNKINWSQLFLKDNTINISAFIRFNNKVDFYEVLKVLDEYNLLKDNIHQFNYTLFVISNRSQCITPFNDIDNIIKYLKYTYNNFGDKSYFVYIITNSSLLRWFLGLDHNDTYKNLRGAIMIPDILKININSILKFKSVSISEIKSIRNVLDEYINTCVNVFTPNINNSKVISRILKNYIEIRY